MEISRLIVDISTGIKYRHCRCVWTPRNAVVHVIEPHYSQVKVNTRVILHTLQLSRGLVQFSDIPIALFLFQFQESVVFEYLSYKLLHNYLFIIQIRYRIKGLGCQSISLKCLSYSTDIYFLHQSTGHLPVAGCTNTHR